MSTFQIDFGSASKAPVVGIDLGTTNSLIAVMGPAGHPEIIPGPDGSGIVPSVVSIAEDGRVLVGRPAQDALITHPERSVYSSKRLMGRGVEDIREELSPFPFRIAEGSESVCRPSRSTATGAATPPVAAKA